MGLRAENGFGLGFGQEEVWRRERRGGWWFPWCWWKIGGQYECVSFVAYL
ncbi:hypothetical protein OIU77_012679, partial [Salix suchowensis]